MISVGTGTNGTYIRFLCKGKKLSLPEFLDENRELSNIDNYIDGVEDIDHLMFYVDDISGLPLYREYTI
jgi:hypothetical protein